MTRNLKNTAFFAEVMQNPDLEKFIKFKTKEVTLKVNGYTEFYIFKVYNINYRYHTNA